MALTRAQLADPDCPVGDNDYDAIESAIMETARGRWFLFEYARRHRQADTVMVMSAINSLHDSLQATLQEIGPPHLPDARPALPLPVPAPDEPAAALPDQAPETAPVEAAETLPDAAAERPPEPVAAGLADRPADSAPLLPDSGLPDTAPQGPQGALPDQPAAPGTNLVPYPVSSKVSGAWLTQQRAVPTFQLRTLEQQQPHADADAAPGADPAAPAPAGADAPLPGDPDTFKFS